MGGKGPLGEGEGALKEVGSWLSDLVAPFPFFLPLFQVGNLGLLFMLLFFIFAALGVELFGDLGELG